MVAFHRRAGMICAPPVGCFAYPLECFCRYDGRGPEAGIRMRGYGEQYQLYGSRKKDPQVKHCVAVPEAQRDQRPTILVQKGLPFARHTPQAPHTVTRPFPSHSPDNSLSFPARSLRQAHTGPPSRSSNHPQTVSTHSPLPSNTMPHATMPHAFAEPSAVIPHTPLPAGPQQAPHTHCPALRQTISTHSLRTRRTFPGIPQAFSTGFEPVPTRTSRANPHKVSRRHPPHVP